MMLISSLRTKFFNQSLLNFKSLVKITVKEINRFSTGNVRNLRDSAAAFEEINEQELKNDINKYTLRSHTCGELDVSHINQNVRLMGWVEFLRMNKFLILRDKYGKTQLFIPEMRKDLQNLLKEITLESVISAEGIVCLRPANQIKVNEKTGSIEVLVKQLEILNKSVILPFYLNDKRPKEPIRLKYRYLDLRSYDMQNKLTLRCKILHKMRRFLIECLDFIEVETPTLFKRTPGGAQEFIVPTRNKGQFFSLVQSPQQFKQMLMVGGIDKYFQIARCYRDETTCSDRQPEFTQLDIEMSFCDREGIFKLIEDLLVDIWPKNLPPLSTPFPRLTFENAMNLYGTDKPDLRFDWKLNDFTELFVKNIENINKSKINLEKFNSIDFAVHAVIARGGGIKFSNAVKMNFLEEAKLKFPDCLLLCFNVKSILKLDEKLSELFCPSITQELKNLINYQIEDVIFMGLGPKESVLQLLGKIRINFAHNLEENGIEVFRKNSFNFLWIIDFPLFKKKDDKYESLHHPFTQPHAEDVHMLRNNCLKVKGLHYDLILNGNEVGGGSIRINDMSLQKEILENILKMDAKSLKHMLEALSYGAPIHGGIAIGIDRLIAILCQARSIREVIAFPKSTCGNDLLSGAPCDISQSDKQLYHID